MTQLHRHQIAWLSRAGWQWLLDGDWDDEAWACLRHWAEWRLPVVVTRQVPDDDEISLGLCAPQRWNHRRLALRVARGDVLYFDEFPRLEKVVAQLPSSARKPASQLATALEGVGAMARVYGSHGWQHLTGLEHVRCGSDLDLWVGVQDAVQADAVVEALSGFDVASCRLDGELVFADGRAVAWREWLKWRAGQAQALLVKRLHGASMETPESDEAFA